MRKARRPVIEPWTPPTEAVQSRDMVLRAAGFKILERPAKGEPVWVRDGTRYPESAAWAAATGQATEGRR